MVQQAIQIFARLKPTKAKTGQYDINNETEDGSSVVSFKVPRKHSGGHINNKKEDFNFKFGKVFDRNVKQDEIFANVAQPVIDNVLQGYNGTIFAYGQTGSGKTFTISGGEERYVDRGIIPRTLSYIFDHCKKNPENEFTVQVSYLQIYNENGHDLLNLNHERGKLEDLPKVKVMEDANKNVHLNNLCKHQTSNEEEALNFLFLGDINREIAETPMNKASTRSHCIFIIDISSREVGSDTVRRSKLNLVDLAGSERVSKTEAKGRLLTEANSINRSLHFLEHVIVSLAEKGRDHVPYRSSMMTLVLRDSLGGNCMTTMIATCSVETKNLDESISTCRFAQRVALIKNDAIQNEELDPSLIIVKLRREKEQLKEELAMATKEQRTDVLTDEDLERCKEAVQHYLDDEDPEASLNVGADMRKIHQCYSLLKQAVLDRGKTTSIVSSPTVKESSCEQEPDKYFHSAEIEKLKELVLQRNNEINILVNVLEKEKRRRLDMENKLESLGQQLPSQSISTEDTRVFNTQKGYDATSYRQPVGNGGASRPPEKGEAKRKMLGNVSMSHRETYEIFKGNHPEYAKCEEDQRAPKAKYEEVELEEEMNKIKPMIREDRKMINGQKGLEASGRSQPDGNGSAYHPAGEKKIKICGGMSVGRIEAFEIFKQNYPEYANIEENTKTIKAKLTEVRQLGKQMKETKNTVKELKAARLSLMHHKKEMVLQGLIDYNNPEPDEKDQQLRDHLKYQRANMNKIRQNLNALRDEIQHVEHLRKKSKVKLENAFDLWWTEQTEISQQNTSQQRPRNSTSHAAKHAWEETPPISPCHSQRHHFNLSSVSTTSLQSERSVYVDSSQSISAGSQIYRSNRDKARKAQSQPQEVGGFQTIGDDEVDANIRAFKKAKQNIAMMHQKQQDLRKEIGNGILF